MHSTLTIAEQLLVVQAQQGDRMALRQLITTYERRLWFYCRRLTGDDHRAWDVVQEVWLTVYKTLFRLKSPAAFRVWLYQIAHHRATSLVRKQIRHDVMVEVLESDGEVASIDEFLQLERVDSVQAGLDALSEEHRVVLTLRFLEDMSIDEIANVLEIPSGTVKSRLFHAKRLLRKELEGFHS